MYKYLAIVLLLLCVVLAGNVFAVPQHESYSTDQKHIMVDRNGDKAIDGVDIYNSDGKVVKKGYDTNNDMVIDKWDTYDENTGMPIVTESDKAFELR